MIRYTLKCDHGHQFDSWFANAKAFDTLKAAGHLTCANCGSASVDKALMAPAVGPSTADPAHGNPADTRPPAPSAVVAAQAELERKLAALREQVEKHSTYVGGNFVTEARAMHDGTAPERPIWGEAKPDEARALAADGVPIMPLPFVPRSKTN